MSTTYLGMKLKNPVVASAGPLSHTIDSMKRLEDGGVSAIVMYSLFEEQITHEISEIEHYLAYGTEGYAESLTYFPSVAEYNLEPDQYVELVHRAKRELSVPIIGSLNGISAGGWIKYAKNIEEAGADALELNVYYIPTDPKLASLDVEDRYVDVLLEVKRSVTIPVAMKLSPFFSSMAHMAQRLCNNGADGLVLFNRFYQPDIDIARLEVTPSIVLSTPRTSLLPMRWIAILSGRVSASLAATGGIHSAEDVIKMVMAGADVTMMCSALLKYGPGHVSEVLRTLDQWMIDNEYVSIQQMKGSMSQKSVADPAAFERANYMKALNSFK